IVLATDSRFGTYGLGYPSTFLIGLYTQPLGFVLLVLWYITYTKSHEAVWRLAVTSLLLAFTILANFFNATTCAFLVLATLASDLLGSHGSSIKRPAGQLRTVLAAHILSPVVALCLTLFWLVPVVSEYDYFVTRPQAGQRLITTFNIVWWLLAAVGSR